jgi:hypothetical protein
MKKIFLLLLILIILISGCVSQERTAHLLPLKIDFKKEEKFIYGIYKEKRIGEVKIFLKEMGEKDFKKEKVVMFRSLFSYPDTSIENKVLLYKKNFLPITHSKIIKNKKNTVEIYYYYIKNFIKIKINKNNKNKDIVVETSGKSYDNETFLFVLRYLQFEKISDDEISTSVEIPQIASSANFKIKLDKNKEEIETKSGKFKCLKLKITVDGKVYHTAYYSLEKPNYLIKYENEKGKYILEKIE